MNYVYIFYFFGIIILIDIVWISTSKQIRKIEKIVESIKQRTPLVPYGRSKKKDVFVGTCPSCGKTIASTFDKYECSYCYQRLDWLIDKESEHE